MRRSNSVGAWEAQVNNNGVLFNQSDSVHPVPDGWGGFWLNQNGVQDTMIYGAGLWVGGVRKFGGVDAPHVEGTYTPSIFFGSEFVPGSLIYGGTAIDSSQAGRDKYRVYRSTDVVGPSWPLRMVNGISTYVDDPLQRAAAGPKAVLSDEDMFIVYKDSDTSVYSDPNPRPFGFEVRTQLCFWKKGLLKDVILLHNQLLYRGKDTIFEPVVGFCIDGDVQFENDDQVRTVTSEGTRSIVFYTDSSSTDPLLGVMVLTGNTATSRPALSLRSIRYWDIEDDPASDSDRYALLSGGGIAHSTLRRGDARALIVAGSSQPVAPGDTLQFDVAIYGANGVGPALNPADTLQMVRIADEISAGYYSHTLQDAVRLSTPTIPSVTMTPNPVDRRLVVEVIAHSETFTNAVEVLKLFNAVGAEVKQGLITSGIGSLEVEDLPSGIYALSLGNIVRKIAIIH